MVGMKANLRAKCTTGNRAPLARQAVPDIDIQELKEKLYDYVTDVGVKESFNLYAYQNLDISKAADGSSLLKKEKLLWVLIKVSPTGGIKWGQLRDAMKYIIDSFGSEVIHTFKNIPSSLSPG